MPNRIDNQKVTDFNPGDTVTVIERGMFSDGLDRVGLTPGESVVVESVHPLGPGGSGSIKIVGRTNDVDAWGGGFGHLMFIPADPAATPKLDDDTRTLIDGTIVKIGDTVQFVDPVNSRAAEIGKTVGERLVIERFAPRNSGGPDSYLINGFGFEWFGGVTDDLKVGDRVRTAAAVAEAYRGLEATVTKVDPSLILRFDNPPAEGVRRCSDPHGGVWSKGSVTKIADAPVGGDPVDDDAPARPMIDFSGPSRTTAREYAETLKSRINKPETNDLLHQIVNGGKVDAYDLNGVLADVFSGCATRGAQSPLRREHTKKARHIAHIVQAVLENHADSLPAYETGERSRKIEALTHERDLIQSEYVRDTSALRTERDEAFTKVAEKCGEISTLTLAASDERRRLCADIDNKQESINALYERIADLKAESDAMQADLDAAQAAIDWTVSKGADDAQRAGLRNAYDTFLDGFRMGADKD